MALAWVAVLAARAGGGPGCQLVVLCVRFPLGPFLPVGGPWEVFGGLFVGMAMDIIGLHLSGCSPILFSAPPIPPPLS